MNLPSDRQPWSNIESVSQESGLGHTERVQRVSLLRSLCSLPSFPSLYSDQDKRGPTKNRHTASVRSRLSRSLSATATSITVTKTPRPNSHQRCFSVGLHSFLRQKPCLSLLHLGHLVRY